MLDPTFGILIVAGLALLLLTAAWQKLRSFTEFAAALAAYRLFPRALLPMLSWLIPFLEVAIAVGLLVPWSRSPAAMSGCAVLLAYALGIAINLGRGRRNLDCGCAGPDNRTPIAPWMVMRNLLLATLLGVANLRWSGRPLALTDGLSIAAGLAAAAILYRALDTLLGQILPRGSMLRRLS